MNKVKALLEEVRAKGHDVWIGGPASPEAVLELERILEVGLPDTLRSFLEVYGAMGIGDEFVSGIIDNQPLAVKAGGIYADTLFLRQDSPEIPPSLWVVQKHEDGAYCMDVARPTPGGEFAILNYEHGSRQHDEPIAKGFEEFLCEWILEPLADEPV